MSKVLCISRQVGSGGRVIGEQVAKALGISFYDKKLIQLVAERSGLSEKVLAEADERKTDPLLFSVPFDEKGTVPKSMPLTEMTYRIQRDIILDAAKEGDCVIVGRCADAILKDVDGVEVYRVFIDAPHDQRVKRLVEVNKLTEKEAMSLIRKRDRQRKAYYDYHTGRKWGKPANYDICINSAKFGIERTVELLKSALQ